MTEQESSRVKEILDHRESEILSSWTKHAAAGRSQLITESELADQCGRILKAFVAGTRSGQLQDISTPSWAPVRQVLAEISRSHAKQGLTPTETAVFIFSLKQPLFEKLQDDLAKEPKQLASAISGMSLLLDKLGLYTTEIAQGTRDDIISRQQQEMLELSTPVVKLWEGVLALPLIGTLDSSRTQVVMENLLQQIVKTGAGLAIIDITGVPTVDTLVAQHLLKTVAAARLMGADCLISGIRPQIAATIVHLGVELQNVTTKATLADAFATALRRLGLTVVKSQPQVRHSAGD